MARQLISNGKKFTLSMAPRSRYDEIMEFIGKNFFTSETVSKTLGLFPDGVLPSAVQKFYRKRLQNDLTLFAEEADPARIVGVMANSAVSQEQKDLFAKMFQELYAAHPQRWEKLVAYQTAVRKGLSIEELTGCKNLMEMNDLIVLPEFRRYRIASELVKGGVDVGIEHKFEGLIAYPTSAASTRIVEKLGFELINRVRLIDVTVKGEPLSKDPEACGAVMVYRVKKSA